MSIIRSISWTFRMSTPYSSSPSRKVTSCWIWLSAFVSIASIAYLRGDPFFPLLLLIGNPLKLFNAIPV